MIKTKNKYLWALAIILLIGGILMMKTKKDDTGQVIIDHIINPQTTEIRFFWKDEEGHILGNFENLKKHLSQNKEELIFAMNGGMFDKNYSPVGLYIEKGEIIHPLNTKKQENGNFYLQPNGVFYFLKDGKADIQTTEGFSKIPLSNVLYATQSGPMLLIDGNINPLFQKGSKNKYIRNGVGLLPNGNLTFALSKKEMNFYDFAHHFQELGVQNALYLDGFVSKLYWPSQNITSDTKDEFGVIIGEVEKTIFKENSSAPLHHP